VPDAERILDRLAKTHMVNHDVARRYRSSAEHHTRAAGRVPDDLSGVHVAPLRGRLSAVERAIRLAPPESPSADSCTA
jgi:hypothetical protein